MPSIRCSVYSVSFFFVFGGHNARIVLAFLNRCDIK
jgi:hypothetical protein